MLGGEAYRGSEREREREIKSPENRVQGAGFRVQGSGCRVQGAGFKVQGPERRALPLGGPQTFRYPGYPRGA